MKIITGTMKGRNFYMPAGIRPTQNITRKAVFDLLGQSMEGMRFVDIFAGSGAVGLEALSCGAESVVFVEKDPKCVQVIEKNCDFLAIPPSQYRILENDGFAAIKAFSRGGEKFDCVFIDPPYGPQLAKKALKTLEAYDILQPNCVAVIQHDKREILPEELGRIFRSKARNYGSTTVSIYQAKAL